MKIALPKELQIYQKQAQESLAKHLVKDVEFSGSTYQVLVEDVQTHQDNWVFMQLEANGQIKDAFCAHEENQEPSHCLHLAVAYLSLFKDTVQPLHQRFARSLWNQLCQLYEARLGGNAKTLIKEKAGHYRFQSTLGKTVFLVEALTPQAVQTLDQLINKQLQETEETSLKFSNLSHEEILRWREGRPPPQLRYDLSYWSDLAKWLMKKQEEGMPYQITFKYSKKTLPNWFQINFEDVYIDFYVSESNLPIIIPALKTVNSPLAVYQSMNRGIERIIYDAQAHEMIIEETKEQATKKEKKHLVIPSDQNVVLEGWVYIPKKGFYAEDFHSLLQTPVLQSEDIVHALTDYTRLISSLLVDYAVHREPTSLSYELHFDPHWNLHITAYLFEPGDLTTHESWMIGDWAFLEKDGFYLIENKRFEDTHTEISFYEVSDFVGQNRAWLNEQENFQTHVRSIEYQLSYQINAQKRLSFKRSLAKTKEEAHLQDFGAWVYLEGHGFYSKTAGTFSHLLKKGVSLSAEQIPLFIKMNREELQLIPGFFSDKSPVTKVGLTIELTDKSTLQLTPHYDLLPSYQQKVFFLFDDFIYVEGEGFHEMSLDYRLPEKYRYPMEISGENLILFLTYELKNLKQYISTIDPRLIRPQQQEIVTNLVERVPEKGRGWVRFRLFEKTERGLISLNAIYQALSKKQPFAFFEAGLIDLKDRRYQWLAQLKKERFEKESETVLLTTLEYMRLNAFFPLKLLEEEGAAIEPSRQLLNDLTTMTTPEKPDMGGLTSHLRSYQEVGVEWLWFLYRQGLSGLLCDDMGLGKTHQAMALLASIANLYRSHAEGSAHHFLIVCPTSVIYHWQEKLQHFLPGLRVCTFYGTGRSLEAFYQHYDILLTSYGILRNEINLLSQVPFEVAIFDEIQIAKNSSSRVYAALIQLNAYMKIGLTGTPIENHLRELKSLFDIVLPSYMPGEKEYREYFVKPIERERNMQQRELLIRLIKPFTLRRKKETVLTELPEKIEEVAYCDLSNEQHRLYTEVLQQRRHHLLQELKDQQTNIPYLHIFALLSSLKQICDHPAVYLKDVANYTQHASGKWDLFVELLREARESQQKVVIFSQYLNMLDIIENYLTEQGIGFASLRGATQNRKQQLQRFNNEPNCEVFVGSLQASGLGIDLTAGSVVIHYDRWWNAARENQATDRVHRIGQIRGVQVFKLVTKGTFEERIDAMIERKGRLMEEVIGVDEQELLKTFTRDELIQLLEFADLDEEHVTLVDTD
jgi:SNF2 family DNA or RNA helicase